MNGQASKKIIMSLDKISDALVGGAAKGQLQGGAGAAIGGTLLSISPAVPESFEHYVQWGCMVLIGVGILKVIFHTIK